MFVLAGCGAHDPVDVTLPVQSVTAGVVRPPDTIPVPETTTTTPERPPVTRASRSQSRPRTTVGQQAQAPESQPSTGLNWASLRQCEAGGNYQRIDRTGTYFGAYQFDLRTWASVGGSGRPSDAAPDEQDMRAQMLYARSGRGPWPKCGRLL